jgi:hypothetical protein
VSSPGQVSAVKHSTQVPLSLQTDPPLSLQEVPAETFDVLQTPSVQVTSRQSVLSPWQSLGRTHPTHEPEPLQTKSPPQSAPACAFVICGTPRMHIALTQGLELAGKSVLSIT